MVNTCGVCSVRFQRYDDAINCSNCSTDFHIKCVNVTVDGFVELSRSDALKLWKCSSCVTSNFAVETKGMEDSQQSVLNNEDCKQWRDMVRLENDALKQIIISQGHEILSFKKECMDQLSVLKAIIVEQGKQIEYLNSRLGNVTGYNSVVKNIDCTSETPCVIQEMSPQDGTRKGATRSSIRKKSSEDQNSALPDQEADRKGGNEDGSTNAACARKENDMRQIRAAVEYRAGGNKNHGKNITEDDFVLVARRRDNAEAGKPGNSKSHMSERKKFIRGSHQIPTVPVGTTQTTFAAVARRAYFYIGNINPKTTKEEIFQYMKLRRPDDEFILDELPMREGALSRAFKLTTDFSLVDEVNKPDFWPQGVIIKKFFRIAKRKEGGRQ